MSEDMMRAARKMEAAAGAMNLTAYNFQEAMERNQRQNEEHLRELERILTDDRKVRGYDR